MKTKIIVSIIIAFTYGMKSTAQLLLLHRIITGEDTITYHDARIFDLKGSVKSCVCSSSWINQDGSIEPSLKNDTINFSINGQCLHNENLSFIEKVYGENNLIIRTKNQEVDMSSGETSIRVSNYQYDNKGMLIKEFGEEPFCGSVQTFEYNYYYNDKGLLVKETIRTQTANDIEVVSYKILEVDKWGNWTKRRVYNSCPNIFGQTGKIQMRKISYYSDEEIKQDFERKRKRRENIEESIKKSDGVKNKAPTFGLG